ELRAPGAIVPARELLEHEPAGVVAGALVLAARVAEAHHEQVQRRGALASTEEAHGLAFGRAGLALGARAGVLAGLRRGLGGTLGSFLALRHLDALGQLALFALDLF